MSNTRQCIMHWKVVFREASKEEMCFEKRRLRNQQTPIMRFGGTSGRVGNICSTGEGRNDFATDENYHFLSQKRHRSRPEFWRKI